MQTSVVNYNNLDIGTRLDAEYYKPYFCILKKNCKALNIRDWLSLVCQLKALELILCAMKWYWSKKAFPLSDVKILKKDLLIFQI